MRSFFILMLGLLMLPFGELRAQDTLKAEPGLLHVSLLTCGRGAEIYSVFGHTAVRITDGVAGTDLVYNYGTFDGYDENFEMNFMRGKLLYYLSVENYADFVAAYAEEGRFVQEQVLKIPYEDRRNIQAYLERNLLPENRAYKYDFFFDNCATRIRDLFQQTHGTAFTYGKVLPAGSKLTFRDIINQYLRPVPWERFGINIVLGSKIDKVMTDRDIMFLPDYLRDGLSGARLNGAPYTSAALTVVPQSPQPEMAAWPVSALGWAICLLVAFGLFVPQLRLLGNISSAFVLLLTGILGVVIVIMWFWTDHQTCANNFNLLWALPTNIIFAFKRRQSRYALIGLLCLFLSVVVHISGVQRMLLPEMLPWLLSLALIFSYSYKRSLVRA